MSAKNESSKKYTIEDLTELTGYSRRTIRFYIQENIIEPPAGRGRGGFYFDSHLTALKKIKELQDKGLRLEAIKNMLNETSPDIYFPESIAQKKVKRQSWAKYEITDGIELNIRKDIEIKNNKKINEIIRILTKIVKEI